MRILWSVLLALFFVPSWSGPVRLQLPRRTLQMTVTPVVPYPAAPARRRVGALVFERGYRLTGDDYAFGGFSSLRVEGEDFLLLNDGGNYLRFRLDARGRAGRVIWAALSDGPWTGWNKRDRDAESMTFDPVTRQAWVGFENANEIWCFSADLRRAGRHAAPPAMRDWPTNSGAEAMVRLHDGRFVVLAEDDPWPGHKGRAAIVFAGDPTRWPRRGFIFNYLPPPDYSPSDMTELPDGRLIVLNRRFAFPSGLTTIVTIIDPRDLRPGATVAGRPIARFEGAMLRDNFEGIAAVREADGTKIWIVSDDNQSILEQTLLLKFRLDEAALPPLGPRR